MTLNLNPLIAAGVVVSTAATHAVYVMFNAAVTSRRASRAASWSALWYMLSAFAVISYTQFDICGVRRDGIVDRSIFLSAMAGSIGFENDARRPRRDRKSPGVICAKDCEELLAGLRPAAVFREFPHARGTLRVSFESRFRVRAIVVFAQRLPLLRPVGLVRIQVNLIAVPVAAVPERRKTLAEESAIAASE